MTSKLSLFIVTSICFTAVDAQTLCADSESVYFHCKFKNGKVASLCANSMDWDGFGTEPKLQWLQYRYGTPKKTELAFPADKRGSIEQFRGAFFKPYKASLMSISFQNLGTRYEMNHTYVWEDEENPVDNWSLSITTPKGKTMVKACASEMEENIFPLKQWIKEE